MSPIIALAEKIFLKKLPNEYITDRTEQHVRSVAKQSIAAAELFYQEAKRSSHLDMTLASYLEMMNERD